MVEAVRHLRTIRSELKAVSRLEPDERMSFAKQIGAPYELLCEVAKSGRLPVPNFAAGGIATPADAALCMALGAEAVFVGSGIFLSENPQARAKAIVEATTWWQDAHKLAEISKGLKGAMPGLELSKLERTERFAERGW